MKERLPWVVKRNTVYLATAQAFVIMVFELLPTIGGLVTVTLTGSVALAGVTLALMNLGRMLMVLPAGALMDRYGRRIILIGGCAISGISAVTVGFSILSSSFTLYALTVAIFSLGIGILWETRIAGADMFPPGRRGEGISYILTGSSFGTLAAPFFVQFTTNLAGSDARTLFGYTWLYSALFFVPAALLIAVTRPDPLTIARNRADYYGHLPNSSGRNQASLRIVDGTTYRSFPFLAAFFASALSTGNMTMVMALAPIFYAAINISLTLITLAVTVHVLGMYVFSSPLGWLADRIGRKKILAASMIVSGASSYLTAVSSGYLPMTFFLFLVGLGWSMSVVASTTMISDVTIAERRGKAIGANDMLSAGASVAFPIVGGFLLNWLGFASIGYLALIATLGPLLIALKLKEYAPGVYFPTPRSLGGLPSERLR